jgi:DNA-binding response OmpR family regulator
MRKPKVVVIDNDRDSCRIYVDTLNAAGYDAVAESNEEQALATIGREVPALVLLDILMPKMSGIHILDLICKDHHTCSVDVIILTNVTDSAIKKECLEHGAKDYIVKSDIKLKDLLKRIDKVISR